jgi:bcr-type benzoyl-CoA reductase subunit C
MVNELRGLARARYIASNREELIRERKRATGKPVIGYLCCFAPPEIISAAGAIPYRITGRPGEATAEADAYMEPYGCSYVRNILAQAAKDRYDFLDGLVISHSCDMVQRLYGIWSYYRPTAYSRLFNVPHQVSLQAQRFFQRELSFFKESLERFTDNPISDEDLEKQIVLSNRNRGLIRELYALRRQNPPLIKGSEMLELLLVGGAIPAEEYTPLLEEVWAEVKNRGPIGSKASRLLLWGSILDDPSFYRMIEKAGGEIVADDTCIGFRTWDQDVPRSGDLYTDLTAHYLVNFQCPRTDRGPGLKRFDYILDRVREYEVDGIIGYIISFCDPHKFDYPDLRDYLKKAGKPMLLIDDNYSFSPAEAIVTRVQAFLEMI